jgi:hypothetical protein
MLIFLLFVSPLRWPPYNPTPGPSPVGKGDLRLAPLPLGEGPGVGLGQDGEVTNLSPRPPARDKLTKTPHWPPKVHHLVALGST